MKILVTGSEGSLGQAVIPKLLLKHEVRGVDSLVRYGQRPSSSGEMSYEFVMGDLADYSVRHRRHHHCTAALVAGTRYRWYFRWQDAAGFTQTILAGPFVVRVP